MLKPYNKAELAFQLGDEIGHEGQNSKVFIAHDQQLNARLVIKQMAKATFPNTEEYFAESSILYLSEHPNVVPIHYACQDAEHVYIAMPYYEHGSLNCLMNQRFLTVREIVKFSSQFLSGLHNIHSKKLIHFDIKPDNILLSDQMQALVSDFGLARLIAANGLAGQDRGYIKMFPPEAFETEEFSIAFDIYQAGLTLYRMCVGNEEFYRQFDSYGGADDFDRASFKVDVRNGNFPTRGNYPEHIPQALINVIKKCLEPDPASRYTAVIEIVNAMAEIEEKLLDWQYSVQPDGQRKWEKGIDDRPIMMIIDVNDNSQATKMGPSGQTRKINEYCVESINRAKIKAFLKEF